MVRYILYESELIIEDCESMMTYGIALYINGEVQRIIEDISTERGSVARLAELFNEEELDPVHFELAVEDFLN